MNIVIDAHEKSITKLINRYKLPRHIGVNIKYHDRMSGSPQFIANVAIEYPIKWTAGSYSENGEKENPDRWNRKLLIKDFILTADTVDSLHAEIMDKLSHYLIDSLRVLHILNANQYLSR